MSRENTTKNWTTTGTVHYLIFREKSLFFCPQSPKTTNQISQNSHPILIPDGRQTSDFCLLSRYLNIWILLYSGDIYCLYKASYSNDFTLHHSHFFPYYIQVNGITAFVDGSQIYGHNLELSNNLRRRDGRYFSDILFIWCKLEPAENVSRLKKRAIQNKSYNNWF